MTEVHELFYIMFKAERILQPTRKDHKKITYDIRYVENRIQKPVVLFLHGFNGFKDWGHFNLLADKIASKGFVFIKMNFSHNGTTSDHLSDFKDLEAFGQNNYSIELEDIERMVDHITSAELEVADKEVKKEDIALIGHSRGGGAAILMTNQDTRIKRLVTWASINDHGQRWPTKDFKTWQQKGVHHILNGRTNQQMPMYYQIVEDYINNKDRLDIPNAVRNIKVPFLAIHGSMDETISKDVLEEFSSLNDRVETMVIPKAGHTFGGKHPYDRHYLTPIGKALLEQSLTFLTINMKL